MKCSDLFSATIVLILVGISDHICAIQRPFPHTVKFKNTSNKEQLIWIDSEYTVTQSALPGGRDHMYRPLAPGETFIYGSKRYAFTRLDVRLNPTSDIGHPPPFHDGLMVIGLGESVLKVTIFQDDAYTVSSRESVRSKILRAWLKTQVARKAVGQKFLSVRRWPSARWDSIKTSMSNLFTCAKKSIQTKKQLKKRDSQIVVCENKLNRRGREHLPDRHDGQAQEEDEESHPQEEEELEDELEEELEEEEEGDGGATRIRRRGSRPLRRSVHSIKRRCMTKKSICERVLAIKRLEGGK